jgi:hypothetical protein
MLQSVEEIGGRQLRRIAFEETGRPTLIRGPANDDVLSYGSAWVEESTGRVFEAEVRLFVPKVGRNANDGVIRVRFDEPPMLGLLVPSRMNEIFATGTARGRSEARYSNFRAFGTSARIVPQR